MPDTRADPVIFETDAGVINSWRRAGLKGGPEGRLAVVHCTVEPDLIATV